MQLSKLGVPYERFPCVTGDTVEDVLNYSPFTQQFAELPRRSAEIADDPISVAHTFGCGFSHWALYDRVSHLLEQDPDGL
jgi:hypothetical protein